MKKRVHITYQCFMCSFMLRMTRDVWDRLNCKGKELRKKQKYGKIEAIVSKLR